MLKAGLRRMAMGVIMLALAPVPIRADEGRIPIFAAPSTINLPGRYILINNLSMIVSGPAITVAAPDVQIDLNGFTVSGSSAPAILVSVASPGQMVIRNGRLLGGTAGIAVASTLPPQTIVIEDVAYDGGSTGQVGIDLAGPEMVVLRRNAITSLATCVNFRGLGPPTSGSIEDNTILGCSNGIFVVNGASLVIDGNRIAGGPVGPGDGITVSGSQGVLVTANTVSAALGNGIVLLNADGCRLIGNIVRSSGTHGIVLDGLSDGNTVSQNVSTNNGVSNPTPSAADGLLVAGMNNRLDTNVLNENGRFGLNLLGERNVFGKNMARGNGGFAAGACSGAPTLFPPDSCNNSATNTSFGDNLIPGPPVF